MKAKPSTGLPDGEHWLYELKFDGFRFLGAKGGGEVRLWSRAGNDLTPRFPEVAEALNKVNARSVLLDGELVVVDPNGRPSFQLIQNSDRDTPATGFAFDLLELDGTDLRAQPLEIRRERLKELLPKKPSALLFSAELTGDPNDLLSEIAARGLEGLIAKRRGSSYEVGRRSGTWLKIKCLLEQEFVIGGFTSPKGSRSHFGALIVGYFDAGKLVFAGKVGTGFSSKTLAALHRQMLTHRIAASPFAELPKQRSRWGTQFTRQELARCAWLEPRLVAQIRFAEWTDDGVLRQPSFLGLREDKKAGEVVRET